MVIIDIGLGYFISVSNKRRETATTTKKNVRNSLPTCFGQLLSSWNGVKRINQSNKLA